MKVRNKVLLYVIVGIVMSSGIIAVIYFSDVLNMTSTPADRDYEIKEVISLDVPGNWEGAGGTYAGLKWDGSTIVFYDALVGRTKSVKLPFDQTSVLEMKFKVRLAHSSVKGRIFLRFYSGDTEIFHLKRTDGIWTALVSTSVYMKFQETMDTSWHEIEVFIDLTSDQPYISIKYDGDTFWDYKEFTTESMTIDNIRFTGSGSGHAETRLVFVGLTSYILI